jgi:hypothetical protein
LLITSTPSTLETASRLGTKLQQSPFSPTLIEEVALDPPTDDHVVESRKTGDNSNGSHKVAILLLTLPLDYQLALQMLLAALEEYNCITQMTPKFE